jgi:hypothetical protein
MQHRVATVAVIVVNWNTRELLAECLASVAETAGDLDLEIIVVDNGSSDGSPAMVRDRFPAVRLITNPDNAGFGRANNQAIAATAAPYVLMLNSDARLCPGALQRLLERIADAPRAGLVGAQLRDPNGDFQLSHVAFPSLWQEALILSGVGRALYGPWYPSVGPDGAARARVVDWVGGACMLARRAAFDAVGGFDEGYFFYGEEVDLCYALRRAGWEVWYEPAALVIHRVGASAARLAEAREARLYRSRLRFFRKHYGARAARLLAAEMVLFTAPKIAVHGLLRRVSGGRFGRRVISLRALQTALVGVDTAPTSAQAASALAPAAPVLVLATAERSGEQARDVGHERFPRVDYVELQQRARVDVLDYAVYPAGRAGARVRGLEARLRSDPYLALRGLRRAGRYERVVCLSERVGIPFAALRRAGLCRASIAVLFQAWSHRQEAAMTRLRLFEAIDVIGVHSRALGDHLVALGAPAERVRVMHWGVDQRFFAPRDGASPGAFALTLGETRHRDYAALFRAVDGLDIELRVLPGGYEYAREKRPAVPLRAPANVRFVPRVSPVALRDLYAEARFVVVAVPDLLYAAGLTAALEAMSMARAVIATRSRGLADYLVDGETCLLVDPGDVAGLRAAIARLAGDPSLARRLGENGRRRVEADFNQVRYVEQLAEHLCLQSHGATEAAA